MRTMDILYKKVKVERSSRIDISKYLKVSLRRDSLTNHYLESNSFLLFHIL